MAEAPKPSPESGWPVHFPVSKVRIARPTDKMEAIKRFYCEGLGLTQLGAFEKHAGYSGVMLGLPDWGVHLEFTLHEEGSPCPAPTKDNLLVLYLPSRQHIEEKAQVLRALQYSEVDPENPYWEGKSYTFEDPDGWRVVLCDEAAV